jgi:hypothetical protein
MVLAEDISEFLFSCYEKHGEMNLTDNINPTFSELEDYIAFLLNLTFIGDSLMVLLFFDGELIG